MVKKCLYGKMPMLVLYTHGMSYSKSVAIVRLADFAAMGGEAEAQMVASQRGKLSLSWYASRPLNRR